MFADPLAYIFSSYVWSDALHTVSIVSFQLTSLCFSMLWYIINGKLYYMLSMVYLLMFLFQLIEVE